MSEYLPDKLAEFTLKCLGDRWKVLIVQNLLDGTKRFGELKRELGNITQKVLTSNLRLLEEKGILVRKVYAQIPPRVDYTLTQLGYELKPVAEGSSVYGKGGMCGQHLLILPDTNRVVAWHAFDNSSNKPMTEFVASY